MYIRTKTKKDVTPNKAGAFFIILAFVGVIITLFLISAFDTDKTVSQKENRALKQRPFEAVLPRGQACFGGA